MHKNYIEQILEEKSKGTTQEILYNSWDQDKKQVEKILSRVSEYYPHYTNHDVQHSENILNNIIRLIGRESIDNFSCTDLWLLLQVAYFHDIGMVIDVKTVQETFDSKEFVDYIKDVKRDINHSLHKQSRHLDILEGKVVFSENTLNAKKLIIPKYFIADFLRSSHGVRVKDTTKKVFYEEFINRETSFIPRRFFDLVYRISEMHTMEFEKVFELQDLENGVGGQEVCHPRLIACLLRLGDLLDIDSDRYHPFQMKFLTELPEDTQAHIGKHLSIKNIRIDNERIFIKSEVDNTEVYKIVSHWFEMIENEVMKQNNNWYKIVPSRKVATIPVIEKAEVVLEGYNTLPNGELPHFTIKTERALELLQGSNIYDGEADYFRELIQNAVDSTYIRVWLEAKRLGKEEWFPHDSLPKEEALKIFDNYPIEISIDKDEIKSKESKENDYYKVSIKDNGIGLDEEDLQYLLTVGNSRNNKRKYKIIEEMPNYLKPSGNFGIGFQSIFNLTDKVEIKTKSIYSDKEVELEIFRPRGYKDKILYKNKNEVQRGSFFHLEFEYKFKKNYEKRVKEVDYDMKMREIYKNIDWRKSIPKKESNKELENHVKKIEEKINDSYLTKISYDLPNRRIEIKKLNIENSILSFNGKYLFTSKQGGFSYKGQELNGGFEIYGKSFCGLNIIGYEAERILHISRNELKIEKKIEIVADAISELKKVIKKYGESTLTQLGLLENERNKIEIRYIYDLINKTTKLCETPIYNIEKYYAHNNTGYKFEHTSNIHKLDDVLEKISKLEEVYLHTNGRFDNSEGSNVGIKIFSKEKECILEIEEYPQERNESDYDFDFYESKFPELISYIKQVIIDKFDDVEVQLEIGNSGKDCLHQLKLTRGKRSMFNKKEHFDYKYLFHQLRLNWSPNTSTMYLIEGYEELAIDKNKSKYLQEKMIKGKDIMLTPYDFNFDNHGKNDSLEELSDEFYKLVHNLQKEKNKYSLEKIKEKYEEFKKEFGYVYYELLEKIKSQS